MTAPPLVSWLAAQLDERLVGVGRRRCVDPGGVGRPVWFEGRHPILDRFKCIFTSKRLMAIELDHWKTEEIKVGDNVKIRNFSFDVKGDRNQENTGKVIEINWNREKGCDIYKVTCDDNRMGYQYLTRGNLVKIPDQPKFDAVANSNPYLLSFGPRFKMVTPTHIPGKQVQVTDPKSPYNGQMGQITQTIGLSRDGDGLVYEIKFELPTGSVLRQLPASQLKFTDELP